MKRRTAFAAVAVLGIAFVIGPAGAQEKSPLALDIGLRLLGADVGIGYRGLALLPGVETTLWAYLGGGYEWLSFYRDAVGGLLPPGSLAPGGAEDGTDPSFVRIDGAWRLGIEQGLVWNERTQTNLLAAFAFYRGRVSSNQSAAGQLLFDATLADRDGIFLNALQAGLAYDDLLFDARHKTRTGLAAETSVEWGPAGFFNTLVGDSDYLRLNLSARAFLALFDLAPDSASNLLSLYVGDFVALDYAIGLSAPVPLYIRQSFGGRDQITGLGHAVRGVDTASLDTNLKAVNNLELRANLPALFTPNLVPGLVLFWDIGYYAQVGEQGVAAPVPSGIVSSTGVGVFIDIFDLGSLAAYIDYRIDDPNADNSQLRFFVVEFGMHF